MENEVITLGWTLLFMAMVVGLLILGHAIFTVLCRTCRPFREWAEQEADEMEDCQRLTEDNCDGCMYVWEEEKAENMDV